MPIHYFWRKDLSKYTLKSFTNANEAVCDTNNSDLLTYDANGTTKVVADTTSVQTLTNKTIAAVGQSSVALSAATLTVTAALHAGKIINMSALAGSVVTLPAATGTGNKYKFVRTVAATSVGDVFQVASGTDYLRGAVEAVAKDDALRTNWGTLNTGTVATESDTLTWNFTTSGIADVGDWLMFTDVATAVWSVSGFYTDNGAEVTPFSAAV